jgi:3-hydroxybutyryl-CoA dehydrogenase
MNLSKSTVVGIVGSGAMGSGIAQVAATAGHRVILYDNNKKSLEKAHSGISETLEKLVTKGKLDEDSAKSIYKRIVYASDLNSFKDCGLIIEAIVENLEIKQSIFQRLEHITNDECILASNTSSLSIASIASACEKPDRVVGIHFFNPAPVMPLVEIIPSLTTSDNVTEASKKIIDDWGKITVLAKDTPGFIVNRVARPFYGEAIRIYEEGIADFATIDHAMCEVGGFKMGPFELMDFIGNDINYKVTETVWEQFFYDPRYKPSLTQKRLFEAKLFGRKTGRGYYNYAEGATKTEPVKDQELLETIFFRIIAMLINEAAEALHLQIASKEDIDMAMTKGVNYPKGLLKWADEIGVQKVLNQLNSLMEDYGEDRYRASILLKRMVKSGASFF